LVFRNSLLEPVFFLNPVNRKKTNQTKQTKSTKQNNKKQNKKNSLPFEGSETVLPVIYWEAVCDLTTLF